MAPPDDFEPTCRAATQTRQVQAALPRLTRIRERPTRRSSFPVVQRSRLARASRPEAAVRLVRSTDRPMAQDDPTGSRPCYSQHLVEHAAVAGAAPPSSPEERYTQRRLLGVGQRGRVEEAYDTVLQRSVALKILQRPSPGALSEFRKEQAITAELDHPGIVTIHDAGLLSDGRPYYTMGLIRGRSLAAGLEGRHADDDVVLLGAITQLCDAVGFAHARGIVHRDLKPANLMLGDFGEAIVVDWGLATHRDVEATESAAVGTPLYMSPEQARGAPPHPTADVWSLGLILYEVVTGRVAFDTTGTEELLAKLEQLEASWSPPVPPTVQLELCAILEKATAVRPEDRYPDAQALGDDVRALLDGRRVAAYRYSKGALLRRTLYAWRVPLAVAFATTAVLVAFAASAYQRVVQERDRAEVAELEADRKRLEADTLAARLLADKATAASLEYAGFEAEQLARQSQALADSPEARGVLAKSRFELKPKLLETFSNPCDNPSFSDEGTLALCSNGGTLSVLPLRGGEPLWSRDLGSGVFSMYASEELARVVVLSADNRLRQFTLAGEPLGTAENIPRARVVQPLSIPLEVGWRSYSAQILDPDVVIIEPTRCPGAPLASARTMGVLVAFCDDATIAIGDELFSPPGGTGLLDVDNVLEVRPGHIIGVNDRSLFHFDIETRNLERVDRGTSAKRGYLSRLRDDCVAVTSDLPGLELWDTEVLAPLLRLPDAWGIEVAPLEDGTFLSTGEDKIFHWELDERATGRFAHTTGLSSVALSPDGQRIATTAGSGALTIWSTTTGRRVSEHQWSTSVLKSASFTPDGRHIIALSSGATGVRVFDPNTLELANILPGLGTGQLAGRRVLSLRGGAVVALSYGRGMLRWDHPLQETAPTIYGSSPMIDGSTSEDGQHAAILSSTGEVWTMDSDSPAPRLLTQAIDATSIDIDNSGENIGLAYAKETVLLDASGTKLRAIPNDIGVPLDLSIGSADGLIAIATHVGTVGVWDLETGALLGKLSGHKRRTVSVEFGTGVLMTASWDKSAQLWAVGPLLSRPDSAP